MNASSEATDVRLLLFQIGDELLGADACQVLRIGRPEAPKVPSVGMRRALVFETAEGEAYLPVDTVHGVRAIPICNLRRMPATALAGRCAIGMWLDRGKLVPLVDLVEMWRQQVRG